MNKIFGQLEKIAMEDPNIISFSFTSDDLRKVIPNVTSMAITTVGHIISKEVQVYAVSPNFFNTTFPEFLDIVESRSKNVNEMMEQLYSVEGSSEIILGTLDRKDLAIDMLNEHILFKIQTQEINLGEIQPLPNVSLRMLKPCSILNTATIPKAKK